jgi:hypothetical protein
VPRPKSRCPASIPARSRAAWRCAHGCAAASGRAARRPQPTGPPPCFRTPLRRGGSLARAVCGGQDEPSERRDAPRRVAVARSGGTSDVRSFARRAPFTPKPDRRRAAAALFHQRGNSAMWLLWRARKPPIGNPRVVTSFATLPEPPARSSDLTVHPVRQAASARSSARDEPRAKRTFSGEKKRRARTHAALRTPRIDTRLCTLLATHGA